MIVKIIIYIFDLHFKLIYMLYKKIFSLIIILFIAQMVISQQSSDIIFLDDGEIIKNCKIKKIEENRVSYLIGDDYLVVEARAIVKKGVFISLEVNHKGFKTHLEQIPDSIKGYRYGKTNYLKLYKVHHRSTVIRNIGIGLTAGGVVSGTYGFYLIYSEVVTPGSKGLTGQELSGLGLVFLGAVFTATGLPFVIIGQVERSRFSKKMENCFQQNLTLELGVTKNGIGIVLTF